MPTKEALKRASQKYEQEKVERVMLRVPKGKRDLIQLHASQHNESINSFINRAIDEAIERDTLRANSDAELNSANE